MLRKTFLLSLLWLFAPAVHADTGQVPGLDANGQCVGDADSDAVVAINEIIQAVNNSLGGCPSRPITIEFKGMVGDDPFACGAAYAGIGRSSSQFLPSDFRLYVSDLHLVTPAGNEVPVALDQDGIWQYQSVALLDFEDGTGPCNSGNEAMNTSVHGSVPAGVYTGVRFTLGVPFALNHLDASTAPSPLNFTAMFWSWQSGYKFLRVDTADDTFRVHLGSTGCSSPGPSRPPTSCSAPNRAEVTLAGFDPDRSVIVADLRTLLADSDLDLNDPETPPGCMSDPLDADCSVLFGNLGLAFPDGTPRPGQTLFRVAPRAADTGHVEILVGSSADGAGALALHAEFDTEQPIPVPFAECLGGSDDECTGGTRVFQTANPGINPAQADDPEEALFALDAGISVLLEVVEISPGLSIRIDETVVDGAGDTALLGTTPEFHADAETQIAVPAEASSSDPYRLTFRLRPPDGQREPSAPLTVRFAPTVEAHDDDAPH